MSLGLQPGLQGTLARERLGAGRAQLVIGGAQSLAGQEFRQRGHSSLSVSLCPVPCSVKMLHIPRQWHPDI